VSQQPSHPGPSSATLGIITIVMTLVGWSSVPLFLKHFSYAIDAWTSNGWRYGFSALLWAPVLIIGLYARRLPGNLWRAALVPSLFNAVGQVAFTWAHYKIQPGLLSFGLRTHIVFVTIGAAILFAAERRIIRAPAFLLGLFMVFGGAMGTVILGNGLTEQATTFGVSLAMLSGLLFACYALSVRYFMQGMNSIIAFAAISQYTAAAMIGLMLVLGDRGGATAAELPGDQFILLLISAVIGIALGHVFYYMSINRLGVAVSSGVIQLQPFLVGAASFALFGEQLTLWQWMSGMVAIAGAAMILGVQHRLRRRGVVGVHVEPEPALAPPGAIDGLDGQPKGTEVSPR
jgi:drug/metabolite transporter (DMT)-like permease